MAEFNQLAEVINRLVEENFPISHYPPDKPREGMIRYADGADWNPGSGKGLYVYDGTRWVKMSGSSAESESFSFFVADD